jgi:hypothetical protein
MRTFGTGPWCILLINDVQTPQQNKLILHTYPELVLDALNRLASVKKPQRWVPILMVGVFEVWNTALWFFNQWNNVKNLRLRIEKAILLYKKHALQFNLCIWIQGTDKPTYIHNRWESPILNLTPSNDLVTVKNIRLLEKQRNK